MDIIQVIMIQQILNIARNFSLKQVEMKSIMSHNWLRLAPLLLILLAASCTPDYDSAAYLAEVLDPQECDLPCWRGVVPEQSSKEDLLHVLEQLPESKVEQLEQNEIPDYGIQIWWRDKDIGSTYNALFQENVLKNIESRPHFDLTLEELIASVGTPEEYIAKLAAGERTLLYLQLFYEDLGVQVFLWNTSPGETLIRELESCETPIPSETVVQDITIMPAQTAESMMNTISVLQNYSVDQLRPWSDEGIYLSNCDKGT